MPSKECEVCLGALHEPIRDQTPMESLWLMPSDGHLDVSYRLMCDPCRRRAAERNARIERRLTEENRLEELETKRIYADEEFKRRHP